MTTQRPLNSFNPSSDPNHNSWLYKMANVFNQRNNKFKSYSHEYFYNCLEVLNSQG